MYILDTDILNVLLHPSPARDRVLVRINAIGDANVWFSIITVYEKLFIGVLPALNGSLGRKNEVRAWEDALALIERFCQSQILEFTQADYDQFKAVYADVKKSPMDCRIAASALTRDWTAVSFNATDFHLIKSKAPDLKFEDWSIVSAT